jgi:hypothetical protein
VLDGFGCHHRRAGDGQGVGVKHYKGGSHGLRPLKKRKTKKQLDRLAYRQFKRKERKKKVPSDGG